MSGQVLRDATGAPYTSAKASYWSDAGHSVALSTYSNADCASGHELSQPVVADGTTGAFPAIYLKAARYWRTVTTSAGVSLSAYDIGPIDPAPGFVVSSSAPSPTYPYLTWIDTSTSPAHLKRRASDDLSWIDLGAVDSLIAAATVAQQITGTSAVVASTPASVGGLWLAGTAVSISANNISLPSTGGGVFTCSTATTTLNTISSTTEGREVEIIFSNSQTITHGSGINTPNAITSVWPAGVRIVFRRGASDWTVVRWNAGPFNGLHGARKLVVSTASDTTATITADSAILESSSGWCVKHLTVSKTVNLAATGANGLDTGSQTTSTWYYLYLISDGNTVAGLASASSSSPTMPAGYVYKMYVGAVRSNGSTKLLVSKQSGRMARYIVGTGTTVTVFPQMVSPASSQSHTAIAVGAFVPATALEVGVIASCETTSNAWVTVAPNSDTGFVTTLSPIAGPGIMLASGHVSAQHIAMASDIALESTNIYYTSGSATNTHASVNCYGWTDNVAAL